MKNFARVMGLLFGSAGAHTYPKSGQVAALPPPPTRNDLTLHHLFVANCPAYADVQMIT